MSHNLGTKSQLTINQENAQLAREEADLKMKEAQEFEPLRAKAVELSDTMLVRLFGRPPTDPAIKTLFGNGEGGELEVAQHLRLIADLLPMNFR